MSRPARTNGTRTHGGDLDDPRRVGWVSVYMSASLWQIGHSAEARMAAENALTINEAPNDLSLKIGANFYLE